MVNFGDSLFRNGQVKKVFDAMSLLECLTEQDWQSA